MDTRRATEHVHAAHNFGPCKTATGEKLQNDSENESLSPAASSFNRRQDSPPQNLPAHHLSPTPSSNESRPMPSRRQDLLGNILPGSSPSASEYEGNRTPRTRQDSPADTPPPSSPLGTVQVSPSASEYIGQRTPQPDDEIDIDSLVGLFSQPGPYFSNGDPHHVRDAPSSKEEIDPFPRRSSRRRSQQSPTPFDDDDDETLAATNDFDDDLPFYHNEEPSFRRIEEDPNDALPEIMPILVRNGLHYLRINEAVGVIVCIECKAAVNASTAFNHLNSDHKIKVSGNDRTLISTWYSDEGEKLADGTDQCPQIRGGGPPFQGIEIIEKGLACTACNLCFRMLSTFTKHWSIDHRKITTPAKQSYHEAAIQTFFQYQPCYFVVNRSLINSTPASAYAKYIEQYAPYIDAISNIGLEADSSKEIPPLLQATQWHTHLKDFVGSKDKIQLLRSIVQSPRGKKAEESPLGDELRTTILQYMLSIKKKAQSVNLRVRQLLMECPL